jgi:hypothetical protein
MAFIKWGFLCSLPVSHLVSKWNQSNTAKTLETEEAASSQAWIASVDGGKLRVKHS